MLRVQAPLQLRYAVARQNLLVFVKFLYDRLFLHIIRAINQSMLLTSQGRISSYYIGILDIFGFEKLERNILDQLCINYTNERLQYQFNWHVFKQEKLMYQTEELDFSKLTATFERIKDLVRLNKGPDSNRYIILRVREHSPH
jgi:myosin heavy subunit